jgi:anti-sigma regulatory factor (Ser/Thr protein kinase)
MTDSWPLRSSLELGALSTAVPCACLHVKHVLWEWGLNGLAESAELLVSELVTNAVNASGQPGQTVSLNLAGNATRVLIEVRDADPRPPAPSEPGEPGEPGADGTGDGVLLIAALSTNWNWYPTQDPPARSSGASWPSAIPARRRSPRKPGRQPCPAGCRAPGRSRRPRSSPTSTSCAASATTC